MNEMDELIGRHFDGELDEDGAARLREWLQADPANLRRFLHDAHLHAALPPVARGDALAGLMRTADRKVVPFSRKFAVPLAIAAAIVVLVSLATMWLRRHDGPQVARVEGPVEIVREGRAIEVRTKAAGSAQIVWPGETTSVRLDADSALTARGKQLFLTRGSLEAQVEKQPPGRPMIVATEHGRVEVLGTRFTVSATEEKMHVAVTSGRVMLTPARSHTGSVIETMHTGEVGALGAVAVARLSVVESVRVGLVAHWPLDEGQGAAARDASGHRRDGTIQYPNWQREGGRAALAISNDAMPPIGQRTCLVSPAVQLPPAFTITLRLRSESRSPRSQVVFTNTPINAAAADGFTLYLNYNEPNKPTAASSHEQSLFLRVGDGQREPQMVSAPHALTSGEWHSLAVKVDRAAGRVELHVDGRAVLEAGEIPRAFNLDAPLWFGAAPSSTLPFGGSLRDIRIYERLLDSEEIAHLARP